METDKSLKIIVTVQIYLSVVIIMVLGNVSLTISLISSFFVTSGIILMVMGFKRLNKKPKCYICGKIEYNLYYVGVCNDCKK